MMTDGVILLDYMVEFECCLNRYVNHVLLWGVVGCPDARKQNEYIRDRSVGLVFHHQVHFSEIL